MNGSAHTLTIGRFSVSFPVFQTFALDGGAMFGSVPKALWNKQIQADEANRIPLASRSLLIEDGTRKILVDAGLGMRWSEKYRDIYQIVPQDKIDTSSITDVILTHLHFDHAAGVAAGGLEDAVSPAFPTASLFVSKENRKNAKSPHAREKASYLPYIIEAVEQHSFTTIEDGQEILPGIILHQADGHTTGLQWVELKDNGETLLFPSDLMPTSHHVHPAYHMGFDMCARTALEEKARFLEYAHTQNALIVFQHDPFVTASTVAKTDGGRFVLHPVLQENAVT
jgi:glyoxylase-like metal-dependent hydrolase (beta-lactamase superfamily II)